MEKIKIALLENMPEKVLFSLTEMKNEDNTYTYEILHRYSDKNYHLRVNNSAYHLVHGMDEQNVQLFNIESNEKFIINYWNGTNDKLTCISLKDFTDEELIHFLNRTDESTLIERFDLGDEYIVYIESKSNIDNNIVFIYSKYLHNLKTGFISKASVSMNVNNYSQENARKYVDNIEVIN